MIRIGLIGYGKAGAAVADVFREDPRFELCWIARRSAENEPGPISFVPLNDGNFATWLDQHPVEAIIDFSDASAVLSYGEAVRSRGIALLTAISSYPQSSLDYLKTLGSEIRVMSSPNITLGINFLLLASKILRRLAPFADVEIVEQHFRDKPEISGTARKLAASLDVEDQHITSLRLGGIVGQHEVIFGFPYQTVRLVHNSIRREAFGTGAAFAIEQLLEQEPGFYTFEQLLYKVMLAQLQDEVDLKEPCRDSSVPADQSPS